MVTSKRHQVFLCFQDKTLVVHFVDVVVVVGAIDKRMENKSEPIEQVEESSDVGQAKIRFQNIFTIKSHQVMQRT